MTTQLWIAVLLLLTIVLAVNETVGIWKARLSGKTKSTWRLITHTLMSVFLMVLLFEVLYFGFKVLNLE